MQDKLINNNYTPQSAREVEIDSLFETLKKDFNNTKNSPDGFETMLIGENNNNGIEKFLAWVPRDYEILTQQGELKMGTVTVPVYGIKAQKTAQFRKQVIDEQVEEIKKWFFERKKNEPWQVSFEIHVGDFCEEAQKIVKEWFRVTMCFIVEEKEHKVLLVRQPPSVDLSTIMNWLNLGYDDFVYVKEKNEILMNMIQNARVGMGHLDLFNKDKKVLEYLLEWLKLRGAFVFFPIEHTNVGYVSKIVWNRHLHDQVTSKIVKI